ncbi:unnamed protein product [Caenorhabditis auriculariae]|uniref:Uncharacterized protein n=1 Tax=Caenorhabditis auriculariae TaxID=2777116 RepID=A0A8S1GVS7_9PELO|nr:unnamed protein product [Caenorhabditis auriculariae]
MRLLTVLLATTTATFASFCGNSGIPFSFETLPDGQPVLGCARPSCFGWSPKGTPISNSANFYRINKRPDGFFRKDRSSVPPFHPSDSRYYSKQTAICEGTYQSTQCLSENQWVGGIAPLTNASSQPTVLQCCSWDPLRLSTDRGIAVVAPGQIVIGGEVTKDNRQYAFDYISNVEKKLNADGSVFYEVAVRRFPCLPVQEFSNVADEIITSEAAIREFNKFGKVSKGNSFAFQAPTVNGEDPIPLPGDNNAATNNVEGPFGEDVVVEEIVAQPGFLQQPAPAQQPPPPPPQQQFVPPQQFPQPPPQFPQQPPPQAFPQPPPQPFVPPQPAAPPQVYYPAGAAGGGSPYYCFTDDTMVKLLDGSAKRMDELKVGDWVQSIGENGVENVPVTFWLHKVPEQFAQFQRLELEDGSELKLTAEHYIYKTECEKSGEVSTKDIARASVFAKEVKEGDCLYRVDGKKVLLTKVDRVSTVNSTGIYSPMTSTGRILVNNIHASCHTIVESHSLQNSFFSYVDYFNQLYDGIFGASSEREVPMGMDTIVQMMEIVLPKNLITM